MSYGEQAIWVLSLGFVGYAVVLLRQMRKHLRDDVLWREQEHQALTALFVSQLAQAEAQGDSDLAQRIRRSAAINRVDIDAAFAAFQQKQ